MTTLHTLQNEHWQIGILPETGASVAFGRMRYSGAWVDVMRPTDEADYDNPSNCSSFIMLPWVNRIKDAQFTFDGETYQLKPPPKYPNARHGDVRTRAWHIAREDETSIRLTYDSREFDDSNFPFDYTAIAEYRVSDRDFLMTLTLKNVDEKPIPGGFGHHPYFVRTEGDNTPLVQIPCGQYFELHDSIPTEDAKPIPPELDFRELRQLDDTFFDNLLTGMTDDEPVRIVYPAWNTQILMRMDDLFKHIIVYTPPQQAAFAVEPMTLITDGFNLHARGIANTGFFRLEPDEEKTAAVSLHIEPYESEA